MPQAVQSGELIPATATAAIGVLRLCPSESRLQKRSGASAVMLTRAYRAVEPPPPALLSSPMALTAVGK
jgi:hypothetical protein